MTRVATSAVTPRPARGLVQALALALALPAAAPAGDEPPPSRRELDRLAARYLEADEAGRAEIRAELGSRLRPLRRREIEPIRKALIARARRVGPRLEGPGDHFFYRKEKKGRYIVEGRPGKVLFVGLHGGGIGSGDASSMAAGMGGGGFYWIFPEVLEKTERGWTDAGTEEFVLELVKAAKRSGKVDPDRVYVTGHSMGGYGAWTLLGHHPDIFAGGAAYAGAPTMIYRDPALGETYENIVDVVEGVIPNLLNSRLFVFQSRDDPRVPPGPNRFAVERLREWKQRFPDGFDFRYVEVDGRGHGAPKEGYLPTQKWVAEHRRIARPRRLIWQPVLPWKRQFHWLYWKKPPIGATVLVEVAGENRIEIRTLEGRADTSTLSLLLEEPIVDPEREVVVTVDGEERWRGVPEARLETLLLTLPHVDPGLSFAYRVDLGTPP